MKRLTQTSDKGGVAFTFDLTISCEPNEAKKILKLAEKLKQYEDLEEQGRLLRLPCKVGDAVYYLDRFCGSYSSDCPSRPCENCQDYEIEIHEGKFMLSDIYKFGKTVFLTEEEAREKLKEMEESYDGE